MGDPRGAQWRAWRASPAGAPSSPAPPRAPAASAARLGSVSRNPSRRRREGDGPGAASGGAGAVRWGGSLERCGGDALLRWTDGPTDRREAGGGRAGRGRRAHQEDGGGERGGGVHGVGQGRQPPRRGRRQPRHQPQHPGPRHAALAPTGPPAAPPHARARRGASSAVHGKSGCSCCRVGGGCSFLSDSFVTTEMRASTASRPPLGPRTARPAWTVTDCSVRSWPGQRWGGGVDGGGGGGGGWTPLLSPLFPSARLPSAPPPGPANRTVL